MVDFLPVIDRGGWFTPLRDGALFAGSMVVLPDGAGLTWPDEIDYSADLGVFGRGGGWQRRGWQRRGWFGALSQGGGRAGPIGLLTHVKAACHPDGSDIGVGGMS